MKCICKDSLEFTPALCGLSSVFMQSRIFYFHQQADPNNTGSVGALDAATFMKKSGLKDQVLSQVSCSGMVDCIGFKGSFRPYFSLYQAISQREGERKEI